MPEELVVVLVAGSFGGCVCPLPCSDLGRAACSLWQEKKWHFPPFFWAFWLLHQPAKAGKKKIDILTMGMF